MTDEILKKSKTVSRLNRTNKILFVFTVLSIVFSNVGLFYISQKKSIKIEELEKKLLQCQTSSKSPEVTFSKLPEKIIESDSTLSNPNLVFLEKKDSIIGSKVLDTTVTPVRMLGQWRACNTTSFPKYHSCSNSVEVYQFLANGKYSLFYRTPKNLKATGTKIDTGWKVYSDGIWTMIKNNLKTKVATNAKNSFLTNDLTLFLITNDKLYSQKKVGKKIVYTVLERLQSDNFVSSVPDTLEGSDKVVGNSLKTDTSKRSTQANQNGGFPISVNPNGKSITVNPNGKPITVVPPKDTTKKNP